MKTFSMNVDHLFLYIAELKNDAEVARESGKQKALDSILRKIDAAKIILDTAFFNTVEENKEAIKIDLNMFDLAALGKVFPGLDLKALPGQTVIEFVEGEEMSTPGSQEPSWMQEIRKMLSRNITKSINPCVDIYIKNGNPKISPADAWIKVKELLGENRLINIWDAHITTTYRLEGPIGAFNAVKKHLPTWDVTQIGKFVESSMRNTMSGKELTPLEAGKIKYLLEDLYNEEYLETLKEEARSKEIVKNILGENVSKERMYASIEKIYKAMLPETRPSLEKKKKIAYVEKGYI